MVWVGEVASVTSQENEFFNYIHLVFICKMYNYVNTGIMNYRSVTRSYYRGAAGALLVYDISNRESYNALANWLADARTLASPNIVVLCVGNKRDLDAERQVTFMEASRFAQENGA